MANVFVYGVAMAADVFANRQMHRKLLFLGHMLYSFTLVITLQ